MAYKASNLSVLTYANGFTMWHYVTDDSKLSVWSAGYFADASRMLRPRDAVVLNASDGNGLFFVCEDGVTLDAR